MRGHSWLLISGVIFLVRLTGGFSKTKRQAGAQDIDNTIIELFNDCRCVFYYQCNDNNQVNTNGENLIDLRIKNNTSNAITNRRNCKGGKFDGEIVCCKLNSTSANSRSPNIDIDFNTDETTQPLHNCGVQRTKINVRIFTEEDNSIDGEFPWIAAIFKKNGEDWTFYCSGSLIHPKVILTANHYFYNEDRNNFKVIITGNIELPKLGTQNNYERNLAEIVNHPKYYSGALHNDGVLLILDAPIRSTKTNSINSICLPPDHVPDTGRCLVAGWGKGSEEDGVQILKKVELPLINFNRCQNLLRLTRLGARFNLHNSFLCAGGEEGKDSCKGDGGSPLMCLLPSDTRYFHAGIVSWGIGCGKKDVPGVYASTAKLKGWILEELTKRNLHL